jgi:cytochrome P450
VFAEPERFDPDRFAPPREEDKKQPYALVTFGGGSRICIGINFAQVEVKALVAHVWPRFRFRTIPERPVIQYGGIVQFLPDGIHASVERR